MYYGYDCVRGIRMNSIFYKLFFLLGLFAGLNVFSVDLKVIDMTVFTFLLMGIVLLKLCIKPKMYLPHNKIDPLFGYYILFYISSFCSILFLPSDWIKANMVAVFSTTVGVFGFYLLFSEEEKCKYLRVFLRGLRINCSLQLVWAFMQFACVEFLALPLNYTLGLRNAKSNLDIAYQVTGLGWERAELCYTMALGFLLFDKLWIKALFVLGVLITQSRTGMILIVLVVLTSINYKKIFSQMGKLKIKIITFISVAVAFGAIFVLKDRLISQLTTIIERFSNIRHEGSGLTHMFYYQYIPYILSQINIGQTLLGFGASSSGYPYAAYSELFEVSKGPWTVESTWLSVLWSTGAVGFVLWISWFVLNIKRFFKVNKKVFSLMCSVLIGGIFYTLLPNWGMLVLLAFVYANVEFSKNLLQVRGEKE